MPGYSLLSDILPPDQYGGLSPLGGDGQGMPGVTTQGRPYIDPISGNLVTGEGKPYTGERPLETPPILAEEAYQPDIVPRSPTPADIEARFNAYAKPNYTPGKIAALIATSPLRFLSGLDQTLKGALGIPTIEDTAEYGRTHYGGDATPSGPLDRLIGAMTGSSRDQERATLQTSHDVLRQMALRKQALETNRKLQQLFSGAYDLYGKPGQLESQNRDLAVKRLFQLPEETMDYETKLRQLGILRETGLPQARATLSHTLQGLELGDQQLTLNELEGKIKAIKYRADRGDEEARQLYDYYFNHPNPEIRGAVRGFIGASAKLLENEPMPPATGEAIRKSVQEGITAQGGSASNLEKYATMPDLGTGQRPAEKLAAAEKAKADEITRQFKELKSQLDQLTKGNEEKGRGVDDIRAQFLASIPPETEVNVEKNARFFDVLHGLAPGAVGPSKATQRTAGLARMGDVLARYQTGQLSKEQAMFLANRPEVAIADVESAMTTAGIAPTPTPAPSPTEGMDSVITEDARPTPRAPDVWKQPTEETRQREASTVKAWTQSYNELWAAMEGRDAPQTGAKYEKGLKAWIANGGKL